MSQHWTDTESDDEARSRSGEFWAGLRKDLDGGQFWADRIKEFRSEPAKRLSLALTNLPLPAAFQEAAVAVRALIRAKRSVGQPFEEELSLLYWLAAMRSFMLEYAPRLREPGFNVVEAVPGSRLRSLRYSYAELGYRELSLLNKTDVKWLCEAWGEPASHSTLNALHGELWEEYENKLIEERNGAARAFKDEIDTLLAPARAPVRDAPLRPKASGCTALVAALLLVAVACLWWLGA
jgi:hypothetical protein